MKILNEFGIKPTRTGRAAGYDFYIPNIKVSVEEGNSILEEFSKSYNKSIDELKSLIDELYLQVSAVYGEEKIKNNELNILHLYLAIDSVSLKSADDSVEYFVDNYLLYDKDGNPGIRPLVLDHVKFNSGIRTLLNRGTAGVFFNKSGKGVKGWDVRACVVDDDYAGLVHLSMSYTKLNDDDGIIYVGDKLVQMLIYKVEQDDVEEIDSEIYFKAMSDSERKADGFGSSDVKH